MSETPAIAHQVTRRIAQDAVRIHAIFLETHTIKVVSQRSYKEELSFSNITLIQYITELFKFKLLYEEE
jgi:hypothetical protein